MIKNLPKRSEIKKQYRPEVSESQPEWELNYCFLRNGLRPDKQYQIGKYFADLAFPEYRLAVEYDGKGHLENPVADFKRHQEISEMGWHILRIMNKGTHYSITLDLKEPDCFFIKENDVYEKAVAVVKDFIKKQKRTEKSFAIKFASMETDGEFEVKRSGGFKSIGELLGKSPRQKI